MRLTILQYGGDYREAWERLSTGGKENYQAQRYSVNFVASLAQQLDQVAVICALGDVAYDEALSNGVRAIGAGLKPGFNLKDVVPVVERTCPDRLVLVTPLVPVLKWARRNRVRTLTTLADSFHGSGVRAQLRHRRLAYYLNRPNVDWVGNHGIGACMSLARIGVKPDRIIPWDWPHTHRPDEHEPRTRDNSRPLSLAYVGTVSEEKGVGDLLRALPVLRQSGFPVKLKVVGRDDGTMRALANELGCNEEVEFSGVLANEDVPAAMRGADVVVIPSRHEYPEGLPLTIYEALAARTPIIASDHPMFRGALSHQESALIFRASDVADLAAAIRRLAKDHDLYARLSVNSEKAWAALQLPVTWGDLVGRWLSDEPSDHDWLSAHRFSSGLYAEQIRVRS